MRSDARWSPSLLGLLAALLCLVCVEACGGVGAGSPFVGGVCTNDGQCQSLCVNSGHYPVGMCSFHCTSSAQCPGGTVCTEDSGGVCALSCQNTAQCQSLYGARYVCDAHMQHGTPGTAFVCRTP